jgi:GNAT superfamily N-acetyltransferase
MTIQPALPAHGELFALLSKSVAYRPGLADGAEGYLVFQGSPAEYAAKLALCPDSVIAFDEEQQPAGFLLAARGPVLAALHAEPLSHMLRHPADGYLLIDQIAVAPHARARGLAQQLLDAAIRSACPRTAGASIMHGPVRNLRSLRFFTEKNGFRLSHSYREKDFEWGHYERDY